MTNSISNTVAVSGDKSGVARFKMAAEGPDNPYASDSANQGWSVFSFPRLCPPPEHILKGDAEDVAYWECEYWGCKWGADEAVVVSHTPNSITYRFHTPWTPPLKLLMRVSVDYPGLTFKLRFTTFGMNDAGTYRFVGGQSEVVELWNGYFNHRPHLDSPIHHRWIQVSSDPDQDMEKVREALLEGGLIVRGQEPPGCFTSRVSADAIEAYHRVRFLGSKVEVAEQAYTLDESVYLMLVHTWLRLPEDDNHGLLPIPDRLRLLYAVAERNIRLADEEIDWVIRGLIAKRYEYGRIERLERLRLFVGQEHFHELYKDLILERVTHAAASNRSRKGKAVTPGPLHHNGPPWANDVTKLQMWFQSPLPSDQSAEWGYGVYAPTEEELEFVLKGHREHCRPWTAARIAEIEAAIRSPRWATEWPAWDRRHELDPQSGTAPQESQTRVLADPEFLAELEGL